MLLVCRGACATLCAFCMEAPFGKGPRFIHLSLAERLCSVVEVCVHQSSISLRALATDSLWGAILSDFGVPHRILFQAKFIPPLKGVGILSHNTKIGCHLYSFVPTVERRTAHKVLRGVWTRVSDARQDWWDVAIGPGERHHLCCQLSKPSQ